MRCTRSRWQAWILHLIEEMESILNALCGSYHFSNMQLQHPLGSYDVEYSLWHHTMSWPKHLTVHGVQCTVLGNAVPAVYAENRRESPRTFLTYEIYFHTSILIHFMCGQYLAVETPRHRGFGQSHRTSPAKQPDERIRTDRSMGLSVLFAYRRGLSCYR